MQQVAANVYHIVLKFADTRTMFRLVSSLALSLLLTTPVLASSNQSAIDEWCTALGKRLRSVTEETCNKQAFLPAEVQTARENALMVRDVPPAIKRISQSGKPQDKAARILVIGGIHGDELTSAALVFRWLQWVDEPEPTRYHWRMIPVANPDGMLASPPTRVNGNGVDLNRNFPTPDWVRDAHDYWAGRTKSDPRRFPGKEANSEIETKWLNDEIDHFDPDVIVSIHAPYGILDYDGPAKEPNRFGRLNLNRLGVYPGSLGNYGGVYKNVPVITIELPHASSMPSTKEQRAIWLDMLRWIKQHIVPRAVS